VYPSSISSAPTAELLFPVTKALPPQSPEASALGFAAKLPWNVPAGIALVHIPKGAVLFTVQL